MSSRSVASSSGAGRCSDSKNDRAALDRQQHQVVHREARQRRERRVVEPHAARLEARVAPERAVGVRALAQAPQQRVGLEARAVARLARRVRAVPRQQHADVHLVGLGLEPREEALHAVPRARPRLAPAHPAVVALEHPVALRVAQVAPRHVERDAALASPYLTRSSWHSLIALGLPGLDRAVAERLRLVGHDQAVVDADHAPEAAAGLAGAERRVEREQARCGIRVVDVAVGAVQVGREAPHRGVPVLVRHPMHVHPPVPDVAARPRAPRSRARARRSTCASGPAPPRACCRASRGRACSPAARAAAGPRPR